MELNWIFLNAIKGIDVHLSKWNLEIPLVNFSATSFTLSPSLNGTTPS